LEANPLRERLLAATSAFRVGRTAEGNSALVEFIDLLDSALRGLQDPEVGMFVLPHVKEIVQAQERGDNLRVADLLEYELQPMI
jgi:hypothetical protein